MVQRRIVKDGVGSDPPAPVRAPKNSVCLGLMRAKDQKTNNEVRKDDTGSDESIVCCKGCQVIYITETWPGYFTLFG